MKRGLKKLLVSDINFAWRHGFYFIYILLTAAYVLIVKNLSYTAGRAVVPFLIYSDPSIVGMFFMGAIVLLERQQGVLDYMMVTPMRCSTYMISKVISMVMVSLFAGCLIMVLTVGLHVAWVWFVVGMVLTSVVHTLLGVMIALKCRTLNELVMLSIPFIFIEMVPVATLLGVPYTAFAKWLPGYCGVHLINGAVHGLEGYMPYLDVCLLVVWCALLWIVARRMIVKTLTGGRK